MRHQTLAVLGAALMLHSPLDTASAGGALPDGFVRLRDIAPEIRQDIRYAGSSNFTGQPVPGYEKPECILAHPVAEALKRAQAELRTAGLSLLVFDCYRPRSAVEAFLRWAASKETGPETRARHYPRISKTQVIPLGYVARASTHSKGTAVDLTIVEAATGHRTAPAIAGRESCVGAQSKSQVAEALDMGTDFDCFDAASHTASAEIGGEARKNRRQLLQVMIGAGFTNYAREWWHFSFPAPGFSAAHDFAVR